MIIICENLQKGTDIFFRSLLSEQCVIWRGKDGEKYICIYTFLQLLVNRALQL